MESLPPAGWGDLATKYDRDVLASQFTAQLATEIGKVHEMFEEVHKAIDDLRSGMRLRTITLIVTIVVASLGQAAMARYLPPPQPPAPQIIIQSPGE